jgi:flagellar hook-basal body complex protein FliE
MDAINGIGSLASISRSTGSIGGLDQASIGGVGGIGGDAAVQDTANGPGGSFMDALGDALGQLNSQLASTDASVNSFAAGGSADLHTVMLEMQEASLSLNLGVQVRDKLLDAYNQIMHLQV